MSANFSPQAIWTWPKFDYNAPLSGAVTMPITLNLGSSGDPAMEQDMLNKVGSYGRQLGRICDVIEVLLTNLDREKLSPKHRKAVEIFEKMTAAIDHTKLSGKPAKSISSI
jgi:hypothetical protein